VTSPNGTTTDLSLFEGNNATIVWDGPIGNYTLSVQVIDGNNCLSKIISQEIEIIEPGDLIFAPALPGTIICSDLEGGFEGSEPGHSQSIFQIIYAGDVNLVSAKITIKNPDGNFVDADGVVLTDQQNPQVSVENTEEDKVIDLAITDTWENNSDANIHFEIILVSVLTSDQVEILADAATDIIRVITILPKPVIEF